MIKCRDNNMPLPYDILIKRIMAHYDVDLSINASVELGWSHYFDQKTLNKLNIVQVNSV